MLYTLHGYNRKSSDCNRMQYMNIKIFRKQSLMPRKKMILHQGPTNPARIRELQNMLANLGFYSGKIDGIFGPNTEAAVIAFQKAQGLNPEGIAAALKDRNLWTIKVVIRLLEVQSQVLLTLKTSVDSADCLSIVERISSCSCQASCQVMAS